MRAGIRPFLKEASISSTVVHGWLVRVYSERVFFDVVLLHCESSAFYINRLCLGLQPTPKQHVMTMKAL